MPDQTPLKLGNPEELFGTSTEKMKPEPPSQPAIKTGKHFTGAGGHVFYAGDKALLTGKFAGMTYTVEKINPTTAIVVSGARRVKASHSLVFAPGKVYDAPPTAAPGGAVFREGYLVRLGGLPAGKTYGGLGNGDIGVVLRYSGKRVSVAKLGGNEGGPPYGLFNPARLTLVTVTQLFDQLGHAYGVLPL